MNMFRVGKLGCLVFLALPCIVLAQNSEVDYVAGLDECCRCLGGGCSFILAESDIENAYCKPDGTIVICEGMMKLFEDEDELAAVVAHEMGHLVAKHKGRQTPEKEIEADRIGLELMAKAGYDPNAAVKFWTRYYERIGWWEGDGTHQEPHERIETLMQLINERKTTNEKSMSMCRDRHGNINNSANPVNLDQHGRVGQ